MASGDAVVEVVQVTPPATAFATQDWRASAGLVEQRLYVTVSDAATSTCTLAESGWTCTLTDAAVR